MTCQPTEKQTTISLRRFDLCSRANAHRVASRLFEHKGRPVAIIRTNHPLQPFHVTDEENHGGNVEVELRA